MQLFIVWSSMAKWLRVRCLLRRSRYLYKTHCLFVENEQDLKEMSSFVSWTSDVMKCGLVKVDLRNGRTLLELAQFCHSSAAMAG